MSKPPVHKRPSLGPLEKPPQKRFTIDANTKILLKQVAIGMGVFTALALIIIAIWYITRIPAFTITAVTATGGETINQSEVKRIAERELEGAYGKLVPKRFFLVYPQLQMINAVSQVDRIKDVIVERTSRTEIAVSFSEYKPYALWCTEEQTDNCLFIDEKGYAFAFAPTLSGGSFVRYRSTASAPEIGKSIVSADDFWKTVTFSTLSAVDKRYVRSVEVDSAGDVYYELVGGSELRASFSQVTDDVIDNVRAIFSSKQFSHLKAGNFKYIDLRFGNKVYVNELGSIDSASSTATSTIEGVSNVAPTPSTAPDGSVSEVANTTAVDPVIIEW